MQLYQERMRHGRYLLHEHPAYASSWREEVVQRILKEDGVGRATCDQCLYGCESEAKESVKEPTTFMTNSTAIDRQLEQRCKGRVGDCSRPQGGRCVQCRGKIARMAALYHFTLCRAILVGFRTQLKQDGVCEEGFVGMLEACPEELPATRNCYSLASSDGFVSKVQIENDQIFKDHLTGQLLDPTLVAPSRKTNIEYFDGKDVWEWRPISEC